MSNLSKSVIKIVQSNEIGKLMNELLTHLIEYGELEAERKGYQIGYNVGFYNGARAAREELEDGRRD